MLNNYKEILKLICKFNINYKIKKFANDTN